MTKQLKSNIYKNLTVLFVLAFVILFARVIDLAHSDSAIVYAVNREVPLPTATPIPLTKEEADIEQKIKDVFGPDSDLAIKVAYCESGLRPDAMNPTSTATGVFQIMASVHGVRRDWLTDPDVNIKIAKQLFDASGWGPWEASRHCWGEYENI